MAEQSNHDVQDEKLPEYAPLLRAYHRAYAAELAEIIGSLLVRPGDCALDLACGDGFYSRLLSEAVGSSGMVWGIDLARAWLALARHDDLSAWARRAYAQATATQLPFGDGSFDLVWCAQSFYSLEKPEAVMREMVRVVRPGGVIAILENDTLHQLLLPWPVDLELEVRVAELRAFAGESSRPRRYYVGRGLSAQLLAAGLQHVGEKAWATTRQAPLAQADRKLICQYLDNLRDRVAAMLEPDVLARLDAWLGEASGRPVVDRPEFTTVWLDRLCWGIKPGMQSRGHLPVA